MTSFTFVDLRPSFRVPEFYVVSTAFFQINEHFSGPLATHPSTHTYLLPQAGILINQSLAIPEPFETATKETAAKCRLPHTHGALSKLSETSQLPVAMDGSWNPNDRDVPFFDGSLPLPLGSLTGWTMRRGIHQMRTTRSRIQ